MMRVLRRWGIAKGTWVSIDILQESGGSTDESGIVAVQVVCGYVGWRGRLVEYLMVCHRE
jgi:hypothetical protein